MASSSGASSSSSSSSSSKDSFADVVVKLAQPEHRHLVEDLFAMADRNKDGYIDYAEHAHMFAKKGLDLTPDQLKQIFIMADKNRDSLISPHELAQTSGLCSADDDEEDYLIREQSEVAFRVYDRNRDGQVSKREMQYVSGAKLTRKQIDRCFEINDKNRDGLLNPHEMEAMIRKRKELLKRQQKQN